MRYRVDFSRLARTEKELQLSLKDSVELKSSGITELIGFFDIEEGHILDSMNVAARANVTKEELFDQFLKDKYPEAKIIYYERVIRCSSKESGTAGHASSPPLIHRRSRK